MRRLASALLLGGSLAVAGCDLAPPYHPTVEAIPVAFKEVGPWQKSDPTVLPKGAWWNIYQDTLLNDLEEQLIKANPDLAAAVASYDAERAIAAQIRSRLFPYVNIGGSSTFNRITQGYTKRGLYQPYLYGGDFVGGEADYEVDLWDSVHNATRAGIANAQAAAADLAWAQLSLEAELANNYVLLRGYDAEIDLLHRTTTAFAEGVKLVQSRVEGKISSGLDLVQTQTELDLAQAAETDAIASRALVEHAIAALTGRAASNVSINQKVVAIDVPQIPTGIPSVLLQRRPDIAAAERRVAAANRQIGVAEATFYPAFTLNILGGGIGQIEGLAGAAIPYWAVGPGASVPLYEGGLRHALVGQAYANWRQATQQYRSAVLAAFQDVEDQLSLLNNLGTEATQVLAEVNDSNRTLDMATSLFVIGGTNALEVVVAEIQALSAQINAIQLQVRRLQASVSLIRALGGGWDVKDLPEGMQTVTYNESAPYSPPPLPVSDVTPAPAAPSAPPPKQP